MIAPVPTMSMRSQSVAGSVQGTRESHCMPRSVQFDRIGELINWIESTSLESISGYVP